MDSNYIVKGEFISRKIFVMPIILFILAVDLIGFYIGYCQARLTESVDSIIQYPDLYLFPQLEWMLSFSMIMLLTLILFCVIFRKSEIIVTDKSVYGKAIFGKRIDLPFDSISAVGTSFFKGIDVGTSSGRIHFKLVKNQYEIYSVISKLLMERQQAEKANNAQNNEKLSNADELKKYKDLLDNGIITQEEFEQKKKQLLGL